MKLFSWNVNGIRAVIKKGEFKKFISYMNPDILCLQETKAKQGQAEIDLPEYQEFWCSAKKAGYSGTAIFVKNNYLNSDFIREVEVPNLASTTDKYGDVDSEGRILVLEFKDFYLADVYTPNSKNDLSRLELRYKIWDPNYVKFLKELEKTKPVITCGDFNAAHQEMDIARPKTNHHSAGFTDEEREGITNLINAGFIDTFRHFHPKEERYTWWSHWGNARANNVGWRIDYFFASKALINRIQSAEIHEDIFGSDHCPISLELKGK